MGLLSKGLRMLKPGHEMAMAGSDAAIGATGGAVAGGMADLDGEGDVPGALTGMAAGGLAGGALGSRRLIMALVQHIKRARPDVPDEEIMAAAEELAKRMS